jgi:polar amino acid transport system substrate-binding protein
MRKRFLLYLLCAAALVPAACGDDDDGNGSVEPAEGKTVEFGKDAAIAKVVPAEIRKRGELVIGTNAPYAPLEFFDEDNKTLIGYDIDIGDAIGKVLGLPVRWENVAFDSIIPGLSAGRYDIGIAGFSAERERLEVVDFVSYYLTGGGFLVKKGSGIEVNDFKDQMCGLDVAVQKGVSQVERIVNADKYCRARGKPPVNKLEIPDQNVVVLTLNSGRADVVVADKPQVEYAARHSNGQLCVTGAYRTAHSITGIAVPKRWPDSFNVALQRAVNKLVETGELQRISKKWGVGVKGAVDEVAADYAEIAEPWGVAPDGSVKESKIFTDPEQIDPTERIFPQPIKEGCA